MGEIFSYHERVYGLMSPPEHFPGTGVVDGDLIYHYGGMTVNGLEGANDNGWGGESDKSPLTQEQIDTIKIMIKSKHYSVRSISPLLSISRSTLTRMLHYRLKVEDGEYERIMDIMKALPVGDYLKKKKELGEKRRRNERANTKRIFDAQKINIKTLAARMSLTVKEVRDYLDFKGELTAFQQRKVNKMIREWRNG